MSISGFLEDIEPHIQYFQELIKRIVRIFWAPPFPTFSNFSMFNILRFSNIILLEKGFVFFLNYLEPFGGPKVQNNWFREPWSRPLGPKTEAPRGLKNNNKLNTCLKLVLWEMWESQNLEMLNMRAPKRTKNNIPILSLLELP